TTPATYIFLVFPEPRVRRTQVQSAFRQNERRVDVGQLQGRPRAPRQSRGIVRAATGTFASLKTVAVSAPATRSAPVKDSPEPPVSAEAEAARLSKELIR